MRRLFRIVARRLLPGTFAAASLTLVGRGAAQDAAAPEVPTVEEDPDAAARYAEYRRKRAAEGTRGSWGVSGDGVWLAAGTPAGAIEVWRADGDKPVCVLPGHSGDLVEELWFSQGAKTLHSGHRSGTISTWDVATAKLVAKTTSRRRHPEVGTSPDGRYLATVGDSLQVTDVIAKKSIPPPVAERPLSLVFLRDPHWIAFVMHGDDVSVHNLRAPLVRNAQTRELEPPPPKWRVEKSAFARPGLEVALNHAAAHDVNNLLVTLTETWDDAARGFGPSALRGWDQTTGAARWEVVLSGPGGRMKPARRAPAIPIARKGAIDLHSLRDGTLVRTVDVPQTGTDWSLYVLSPDASVLYTADKDGTLLRIPLAPPADAPK